MKTLKNQTLLYDAECPLCQVYTEGFIKSKMLDNNGRKPFGRISEKEQQYLDLSRASNEIALMDTKNKTVIYGVDSLLKILGNSFPWMESFGKSQPIHFFLKKLYAFISYNRKVIIPNAINKTKEVQCVPQFNMFYRLAYILVTAMLTALVLYSFSKSLSLLPTFNIGRELLLAFGQLFFQMLFIFSMKKQTIITYFGNLMTVSLMGSLLLLPIILLNITFHLPEIITLGWFGITVLIMFFEHFRRVKLLNLPFYLSYTWVLYRIIALVLILNLI